MNIPRSSQEKKTRSQGSTRCRHWAGEVDRPRARSLDGCHGCHDSRFEGVSVSQRSWSLGPLGDRLAVLRFATQELPCVWRTQGAWGQRNRGVSWKEPPRIAEWPFWNGGEVSLKAPSTPPYSCSRNLKNEPLVMPFVVGCVDTGPPFIFKHVDGISRICAQDADFQHVLA